MSFRAYKERIDRASLEELSDVGRAIESDRKLTGRDKTVLNSAIASRVRKLGEPGRAG